MLNAKTPFSLQQRLDPDAFRPATEAEKEYISKMRPSSTFFKDGVKRLLKNKVATVSLIIIVIITLASIILPYVWPYSYDQMLGVQPGRPADASYNNLSPFQYGKSELKKIENEILGANDKILALEAEIFAEVREFIAQRLDLIQQTAEAVAALDVLCSYAVVSIENNYCRPMMSNDSVIEIKDGRHPVVEKMVNDVLFTPNDVYLDTKNNRLMIITGPNMSGKSTFMRQVAVIVLMAQIGCFVPASYARLGVVDRIFTRVGASDDLSAGQSTFMVEMTEVATILNEATGNSLVILDEIGRGTSTYDGVSIAKAVAEYINSKAIGCKTLFATHYHELISLEDEQSDVRNFSVKVKRNGDDIKFLHKIVEGGTDDSYGIQVARLAGLPQKVIDRAKALLSEMEKAPKMSRELELREKENSEEQMDFEAIGRQNVINEIKTLDLDDMTPREAYAKLEELKSMLQ